MCVWGGIVWAVVKVFFVVFFMHSAELKKSFARRPSRISADQHGQKPLRLISTLILLETRERAAREDEGGSSCL